jgi:ribosomal-protein-alanine N-acetyltransferase
MNPDGLGDRLPRLGHGGVLLRPLDGEDARVVFQLFSDPAIVRFMSIPRLTTPADAQEFIASIDRDFVSGSLYQWGIELDGSLVGTCTLAAIDRTLSQAEVGFAVLPQLWGRRIASQAVPLMMEFAFKRLGLARLEAQTDAANAASIALLAKLGFERKTHHEGNEAHEVLWVRHKGR